MQLNKLNKKQIILLIALAAGILLMILPVDNNQQNLPDANEALVLEGKIARLIENTYSADDVSVILTYDTNGEKITSAANQDDSNSFVLGHSGSEPFVVSEKLPYVRGVLISANVNEEQAEQIRRAVATLLGISESKVNVIY